VSFKQLPVGEFLVERKASAVAARFRPTASRICFRSRNDFGVEQKRIAAKSSGILMYHPPGRQFAFGKSLAVEFTTEVLQALVVIWLLTQTRIGSFAGRVGLVLIAGILASITTIVLELVQLPWCLHRQSYTDRDCQFRSRWRDRRGGATKP